MNFISDRHSSAGKRRRLYLAWTHFEPTSGRAAHLERVNPDGSFTRLAGNGSFCNGSAKPDLTDTPALDAPFCAVFGMTVDEADNLYISDGYFASVFKYSGGRITRIAGSAKPTVRGDGGLALESSLGLIGAIARDRAGNLFMLQGSASRLLPVTATVTEALPYRVRLSTSEGGNWLRANRTSGLTGEALAIRRVWRPACTTAPLRSCVRCWMKDPSASRSRCLSRRAVAREERYANACFTTFPATSVKRKSRPWKRKVSLV